MACGAEIHSHLKRKLFGKRVDRRPGMDLYEILTERINRRA